MIVLLLLAVPVAEIWILWILAHHIGVLATIGVLIASGIAGSWIARHVGARSLRKMQEAMASGQMPGDGVLGGVLVLLGSILLLTIPLSWLTLVSWMRVTGDPGLRPYALPTTILGIVTVVIPT